MFTIHDVVAEVRSIASAHPDYTYRQDNEAEGASCSYVNNMDGTTGGCIVGRALQNLGMTREELIKYENKNAFVMLADIFFSDGVKERHWVSGVQSDQDMGLTWGEAVENADRPLMWRGYR